MNTATIVDPAGSTWQIGALQYHKDYVSSTNTHTVNLNGATLIVDGNTTIAHMNQNIGTATHVGSISTTFSNGTLQLGTSSQARNLTIGRGYTRGVTGTLTMAPGTTFRAYLDTVMIGESVTHDGYNVRGYLDLRGATIDGGTLRANHMYLQHEGRTYHGVQNQGYIYVNDSSNLQNLEIAGNFHISTDAPGTNACYGRIGNPANNWALPDDTNVKIGVSTSQRGELQIGVGDMGHSDGLLRSGTGGTFTAYLTDLLVGVHQRTVWEGNDLSFPNNLRPVGVLDMASMTSISMDVSGSIRIGDVAKEEFWAKGYVYLPDGTVNAGSVDLGTMYDTAVGNQALTRTGELTLNGTELKTGRMTVGPDGTLIINVAADGGGIDITSSDWQDFTIAAGGTVMIVFASDPLSWDQLNGVRMAGDHLAYLEGLEGAGKLILDTSNLSGATAPYLQWKVMNGFTVLAIPEPASVLILGLVALGGLIRRR